MNTRLSQDAADTLHAYEAQSFRQSERARWARAQPPKIVGRIVFPPLTEREQAERKQQIEAGELPF